MNWMAWDMCRDYQDNFVPELQMNTVSIKEDLNPLIGFDATWVNSLITRFEYRKSRLLTLSLANNQLTESSEQRTYYWCRLPL